MRLRVVIFSMLVSSGLGSNFSGRIIGKSEGRLIKALGCVAFGAALLALAVSTLLGALVWLPFGFKVALTVAMIAPLGFVMGMPFPIALQRLERWHAPSVRWAWSLNAASSVLGSVGALVWAIYMGLVQTVILGGFFYLAALAVIARERDPRNAVSRAWPGPSRAGQIVVRFLTGKLRPLGGARYTSSRCAMHSARSRRIRALPPSLFWPSRSA